MAGVYWREAATLVLVGRSHLISRQLQNQKNAKSNSEQDYKILTLQRSSKSSFMPNAVVFPGGTFENADLDPKWINLFESNGYTLNDLIKLLRFHGPRIDFYSNAKEENILPELAYRVCAVRETFEESGLLLANKNKETERGFVSIFPLDQKETEKWRSAVHNDPSEFINLFKHINAIPSVFNLFDWSAWLTPTYYGHMKRRFNTIFFTAFTDSEIPFSEHDDIEIQKIKIDGSINILKSFYKDKIQLMPPQIYECSCFAKFMKFQDFHEFCKEKSSEGFKSYLPVRVKCADATVHLLPGDELYPKTPNYYKDPELKVDQTLDQLNSGADRTLHRAVLDGQKFTELIIRNMDSENGGVLLPYSSEDFRKNFD